MTASADAAQKFDPVRAGEYEQQSRIALAGYDACHELSACMLAAVLGSGNSSQILVAGAGGGAREILTAGPLEPQWRFTAVDPSASGGRTTAGNWLLSLSKDQSAPFLSDRHSADFPSLIRPTP
jgi:hypothetical protein